jgi:creatinine amidohydrolase
MRKHFWADLTTKEFENLHPEAVIAILPIAAMEQHGPHLAVGVDTVLCETVCQRAAEALAAEKPIFVAPTLW